MALGGIVLSNIVLVTGGAKSGKSSYAEGICKQLGTKIAYIATSIAFDEGMKDRIKKHRQSRPSNWGTFEIYKDIHKEISTISKNFDTVILDCVTLLVNNIMFDMETDYDKCSRAKIDSIEEYINSQIESLIEEIKNTDLNFIFVTNELGMGIMPMNRLSRIYCDIAGKINQKIASKSDVVYFVVSGIPMKIKG